MTGWSLRMFAGLLNIVGKGARLLPLVLVLACLTPGMARPAAAAGPTVTKIEPDHGPIAGGTTVTMTGSGFTHNTMRFVQISTYGQHGYQGLDVNVINDNKLTFTTTGNYVNQWGSATGSFSVSLSYLDANGFSGSIVAPFYFTYDDPFTPGTGPLPDAVVGKDYSQQLTMSDGGFGPVTYSVANGSALPDGLTLSKDGLIHGTPKKASAGSTFSVTGMYVSNPSNQITVHFRLRVKAARPDITGISPAQGSVYGGDTVTITGSGLTDAKVQFNGQDGTVDAAHSDDSHITVKTPPSSIEGDVNVSVTNADGSFQPIFLNRFRYTAPVFTFSPGGHDLPDATVGQAYNQQVTMSGGYGNVTYSLPASDTLPDGLRLDEKTGKISGTPSVRTLGSHYFLLTGTDASGRGSANVYTINVRSPPQPVISKIDPPQGLTSGGTQVTISGTGLAGTVVRFGGKPGTVASASDTMIVVTTPSTHTPGPADVLVSNGLYSAASKGGFTYKLPAPTIASITPPDGLTNGGERITITGTGLDGATVSFDGTKAVSSTDKNEIRVITPPHGQPGPVDVTVTNADGSASVKTSFKYWAPALRFDPPALPDATVGAHYSQQVTMSGGLGPVTYSLPSGSVLPDGLKLDEKTGVISGTPKSRVLITSFTVTGTDSLGQKLGQIYNLTVRAAKPFVTSIAPDHGSTSGGTKVTISGTGLADVTNAIFDTTVVPVDPSPTDSKITVTTPGHKSPGVVNLVLVNADYDGSKPKPFTYDPAKLSFTPAAGNLPQATVGQAYSPQQVTMSGGTGAVTYSLASGSALPAGLTLSNTGLISGTPDPIVKTTSFTVTGTDSIGQTQSAGYTLKVQAGPPAITSIAPDHGSTSGGTKVTITGSGFADAKVTFGGKPGIVTSSSYTKIVATPPASGTPGPVDVIVTAAAGTVTATQKFTYEAAVLSFDPPADQLPAARVGKPYSQRVTMSGGFGKVTYTGAKLPAGLMITKDGLISGLPKSRAPNTSFTVTGKDSLGQTADLVYMLNVKGVAPVVNKISPVHGSTSGGTKVIITGSGLADAKVAFEDGTQLPPVSSPTDKQITVTTPAHKMAETVNVGVFNADGDVALTKFTFDQAVLSFTPAAGKLPEATAGKAYSQQVTMSGGAGAVTYSLATGSVLPAGLTLSDAGLISGTPAASVGNASFTVTGTDSIGQTQSASYTLNVKAGPPTISLIDPAQGSTSGGTPVTITGTGLAGATVTFGGKQGIVTSASDTTVVATTPASGTPGPVEVTVKAAAGTVTATQKFTYVAAVLSFDPPDGAQLLDATVGADYIQQVTMSGGSGAVTYSLASGSVLPDGLALGPTGLISGKPAKSGDFVFDIKGTDSATHSATAHYKIHVNPAGGGTLSFDPPAWRTIAGCDCRCGLHPAGGDVGWFRGGDLQPRVRVSASRRPRPRPHRPDLRQAGKVGRLRVRHQGHGCQQPFGNGAL